MHGYIHGVLSSGSDCVCIHVIYVLCMDGCTAGFSAEATACSFDLRTCVCVGYTVCFLGEATAYVRMHLIYVLRMNTRVVGVFYCRSEKRANK